MIRVLHTFRWGIAGHAGREPWALIWKGEAIGGNGQQGAVYWHSYYKRWNLGSREVNKAS
jgi:hypothetical protein